MGNIAVEIRQIDNLLKDRDEKNPTVHDLYLQEKRAGLVAIRKLWDIFGSIPMDPETECIEEPFLDFPAGTFREDIWHWFEDTFGISVAEDLMYESAGKAFTVKWHAPGYMVTNRCLVIAGSLPEAKVRWSAFVLMEDHHIRDSWEKAQKSVKYHTGGYIRWSGGDDTDREPGCYMLEPERSNMETDHLRD